jgi:hypothetical protein
MELELAVKLGLLAWSFGGLGAFLVLIGLIGTE